MASGRAIDHVVLTVRDLDAAAITYQRLGFTLTPRAAHDDQMGTSNRLAQFRGRSFIELLEVDRPETLARHEFAASPRSSALVTTTGRPCGSGKGSRCWSSRVMTPEPISAASPPPAYLPLHRSISRGRPSCLTTER